MQEAILEPLLRRMRLRRVFSHIPKDSKLLDVGCGHSASFLRVISPHIAEGYGLDFKVKDCSFDNIKTIQQKLETELPFPNNSFDVVTMLAVLEHIEQDQAILQEIHRVLVPGGKLVLTVPSVWAQPVLEFLSYKLKIVSEAEIRDHKRYYTREKLKRHLINQAGFDGFYHRYFQLWMNNFCVVYKPHIAL